jgi:hypothetical protein
LSSAGAACFPEGSRTQKGQTEAETIKKKKTIYKPFDAAAYLDNDVVIAKYLSAAAEDPNPEVFVAALGDVARAMRTKLRSWTITRGIHG